ncbi:MAG: alpha-xylosidase, partial [Muribaculaceae bacterium]|nr:alpha-xylosidase [Muribaculaceae bacterium]
MKPLHIALLAAAAATAAPAATAETRTVGGVSYLLSMPKDMSEDFLDFSNTYFFADSLVDFDTATGTGHIEWKRQQLQPRQAFNANTYLHQP